MTELQIKYQALQLDRERVAKELALNERQVSEVERHNLETEAAARENLAVSWHQAETARINAGANVMNAQTNRLNYGVNLMNAETNRMNAETNRLNYGVNLMNAQTASRNAAVNERNAAVNELQYGLSAQLQPYKIAQIEAETAYSKSQTEDLANKQQAGYWQSASWSNYNSRVASSMVQSAAKLMTSSSFASAANAFGSAFGASYSSGKALSTNVLPTAKSSTSHAAGGSTALSSLLGSGWLVMTYGWIKTLKENELQQEIKVNPELNGLWKQFQAVLPEIRRSERENQSTMDFLLGAPRSDYDRFKEWLAELQNHRFVANSRKDLSQ